MQAAAPTALVDTAVQVDAQAEQAPRLASDVLCPDQDYQPVEQIGDTLATAAIKQLDGLDDSNEETDEKKNSYS